MFKKENIKNPVYIEDRVLGFEEDIHKLSWSELINHGIIKETIDDDDDVIILSKEFVSFDKESTRKEQIILSKDAFLKYKKDMLSDHQVTMEINKLTQQLQVERVKQNFEVCSELRDKISFLSKYYKIMK